MKPQDDSPVIIERIQLYGTPNSQAEITAETPTTLAQHKYALSPIRREAPEFQYYHPKLGPVIHH